MGSANTDIAVAHSQIVISLCKNAVERRFRLSMFAMLRRSLIARAQMVSIRCHRAPGKSAAVGDGSLAILGTKSFA